MKIKIYTRSMNARLYQLSQNTIDLPYHRKGHNYLLVQMVFL